MRPRKRADAGTLGSWLATVMWSPGVTGLRPPCGQSDAYDEYRARRVVVEHRLARLVQLGIRQSRYFGRVKTRFQLYLAATVANLALVAGKIGLSGSSGGGGAGHCVVLNDVHAVVANAAANSGAVRLGQLWSVILLTTALLPQLHFQIRAFRPGF